MKIFSQPQDSALARVCRVVWIIVMSSLQSAAHAASHIPAPTLSLSWKVVALEYSGKKHDSVKSIGRLTLANESLNTLPQGGWSLYFTCIAGIDLADKRSNFSVERVNGTLFRIRPPASFGGLGSGQSIAIDIVHPELMNMADKGPQGPYVAFDGDPSGTINIEDYRAHRGLPDALAHDGPSPVRVSAVELYEQNREIADISDGDLPPVLPVPVKWNWRPGSVNITAVPPIIASKGLENEKRRAREIFGQFVPRSKNNTSTVSLNLAIGTIAGQTSPESYALTVDPDKGIAITGASAHGVAHGLESMRQLLKARSRIDNSLEIPAIEIVDAPRFEFRGMLLDVARNFHSKESVFRLLDLMARFKLNKLHFHLTDDEGWRLEIPGLPELTQYGARRGHAENEMSHLLPAHGSGPRLDDKHGSGYYSTQDYIEILRYASNRHIEVIPEIEMPGHARAAVKAMDYRFREFTRRGKKNAAAYLLADHADQSRYLSAQLHNDNVIDPGLPSTYAFIEHVVGAVVALYKEANAPLRTIHVGGDELADGAWEKSPSSLAKMKRLNTDSTADLWNYFYGRVDAILKRHGLHASGWEELGARKTKVRGVPKLIPNPAFIGKGFDLYVWNNLEGSQDLAYRLANAGYRVVLAPATHLYFDMAHSPDPAERGVNWAAYSDTEKIFRFQPFDMNPSAPPGGPPAVGLDALTDYGRRNVIGMEATLFAESMRDWTQIEFLLMPRMLAFAERAWAADEKIWSESGAGTPAKSNQHAWSQFANLLGKRVLPQLDEDNLPWSYRIPPPGIRHIGKTVDINHQFPGFVVRYTTDGSEPTLDSPVANGTIISSGPVKAAAFDRRGRSSRVVHSVPTEEK